MDIKIPTVLLDGAVLTLLKNEDLYGYTLTKTIQNCLNVSESTVYPVLRRLAKEGYLTTYDEPYEGRMRRYYHLAESGQNQLAEIRKTWIIFRDVMDTIIGEGAT
ncbi:MULTISPECIES: PadR family transcriptional regulator [unclassified Enterococcus]|uniref:PadR family transcriptional regulator n=1 Tax=unclassified Enterococcus TaxID=2608891 RepID=UPI001555FBAE|nr:MULTISPECIES: PadR family transcriptional regulator [unclassified Enterococcus]MBS7575998.1 PadR family transcriptional regulator [Enterococcus sp. MMGLQ5-2]MBS7583231.1 PadR family transcriptional regulator [Enterococcus sp. MMGLQ5-1]NPD11091.1 PadR family transcriptional regulator [Enterococcus sp. MMGLQ5-1]NPD35834.1 PadR family transcriptional regulator [Enterococcus sp. MMGLQ5-2]